MLRSVLPALLLSRIWIAFFVYLGHFSHPFLEKIEGGYAGVPHWLLNAWTTFDSQHFFSIAAQGYAPKTTPFFPLIRFCCARLGQIRRAWRWRAWCFPTLLLPPRSFCCGS